MPNHPTASRSLQTWGILQQTYVLASRYFESVTARFGLSHPQTAVLSVLAQHDRPLPLSHIARLLTQEAQSTTELADRLERRGYVTRVRDARDRRLVLLQLTEAGRNVIDEILPALAEAGDQLFGALEPGQSEQFHQLLVPVRDRATERLGIDRSKFHIANGAKSADQR